MKNSAEKLDATTAQTVNPVAYQGNLPPPVLQGSVSSSRRGKQKKSARIDRGLRVHWEKFKRKLGSGTAPSTSSALDDSTAGDSSHYNRSRQGALPNYAANYIEEPDDRVDEVIVDREWSDEIKSSSVTHSEHGGSPEKSGGSNHLGGTNTDHESLAIHVDGFWALCTPLVILRWRIWPAVLGFFSTHFMDEKSEMHYNKENWFLRKNLAVWSSIFYIANWVLAIGFIARPVDTSDKVFYYGVAPALSFPILPMVIYDWPRDRNILYQLVLVFSTWSWSIYQILFMYLCNFYKVPRHAFFSCNNKDFLTLFYYTTAMQTIALFGLKLHRFPAVLGSVCFFVLTFGLIVPDRTSFIRNIMNFAFFQGFLLYVHYMRESAERRLYTLRDQLKVQFRATQKAQVNERKAADSKRRLTSYVFHEVRVPLNTALLAVQNLEASGTVAKAQDIEFKALEGSLSMMSKVLNDMLDFNRMDSGRFESVLKPYAFHQVMRSLFVPLQLATDARGLELVIDLDQRIDDAARRALYEALGNSDSAIKKRFEEHPEAAGIVVGDETRLRQIITNLASNACKFTPAGGKLIVSTRLVMPHYPSKDSDFGDDDDDDDNHIDDDDNDYDEDGDDREVREEKSPRRSMAPSPEGKELTSNGVAPRLSATHLSQHNDIHSKPPPLEWIVVRIEVTDTGCGIRPKDMVQSKLFSAFNQTEQGRLQGGKGTGLGLALVRQIVKLSGGRLGLKSKVGEGSTFWVELPLGIGNKALPALLAGEGRLREENDLVGQWSEAQHYDFDSKLFTSAESPDLRNSVHAGGRNTPALHSIMEQGGLVEISARRGEHSRVLTRTIGDPFTGTDPITQGDCSPSEPSKAELDTPTPAEGTTSPATSEQSTDTVRLHLPHLPTPGVFTADGVLLSPASTGTASSQPSGFSSHTAASGASDGALRVLVVDDDPLTRKLMSRMLTRLGCKVATADNGGVALDMILGAQHATPSSEDRGSAGLTLDLSASMTGDEPFAVVFLDNQMPVLSGLEAVAKLRELGRRDFVVGVTGNAMLADQKEYLEAGVDHVLTKPVLEKSLKSMLIIADERRKRAPAFDSSQPPVSS